MSVFDAAVRLVLNLEGGLSLDERDAGNWSGGKQGVGELKGTKYGISAASYPHLDIANLTKADAIEIYRKDFYEAVGGDQLPAPLAVVALDCAINSGVGTALRLLRESNYNLVDFIGRRFKHYASLDQFDVFGRGWVRRFSAIVQHAATLGPAELNEPHQDRLLLVYRAGVEVERYALGPTAEVALRASPDGSRLWLDLNAVRS